MLGAFFYRVYEFLFSFSNPVPARHVISFVRRSSVDANPVNALHATASSAIRPPPLSTDYSVVSSSSSSHSVVCMTT